MSFDEQRERMVETQLKARGITDERLLNAFRKVPRHRFIPREFRRDAYADYPLPLGPGQTISQPYMCALMTSALRLHGHERVLEIGTGSGYQTAMLAELALEVFSIEWLPDLLPAVRERLIQLGYHNVQLMTGNGTLGWPAHAPYDAILVSAAAPDIPDPLLDELADGGRMVLPVGSQQAQTLVAVEKHGAMIHRQDMTSCVFVPLLGAHGWPSP